MITVRLFCCFFYLWCELTNIDLVKTLSCASAGFLRRRMSSPDWDVAGMVGGWWWCIPDTYADWKGHGPLVLHDFATAHRSRSIALDEDVMKRTESASRGCCEGQSRMKRLPAKVGSH